MIKKIKNSVGKNGRFFLDYLKFSKFLKNENTQGALDFNRKSIAILVLPWMGTAVPWYSITLTLLLAKNKKNVFIIFDDMPFGDDELFHKVQSKLILNILKKSPIKFIKLSDYNSSENSSSEIEYLSKLNSLHYTKGETNQELRQSYERKIEKQLTAIYSKIAALYKDENFSQIILPGGIWGSSGIFSLFTKKYNIQLSTYDSGEGVLLLSIFGIAAQLKDIPFSFNEIMNNSKEKEFAFKKGQEQLQKRRDGQDMYNHFSNNSNMLELQNDYYLMLLNSVWDSAALGLHTVYESMIDWILDSIEWVINNSDKTIVIRQHPAERVEIVNNTDSYEKQIENRFGKNKRIVFIEAKNDMNTYSLIEKASCILGFSSTSIVESVALNIPAIIVSSTYYADFKIVYNTNSKKEYYKYLEKASKGMLVVTQDMKERAFICNYITQSCNWYKTDFTPIPNDFKKWYKLNIDELNNKYLPLKSICDNVPISILQHKEKLDVK